MGERKFMRFRELAAASILQATSQMSRIQIAAVPVVSRKVIKMGLILWRKNRIKWICPCMALAGGRSRDVMKLPTISHPLVAFLAGALVTLIVIGVLLSFFAATNRTGEAVSSYRSSMDKVAPSGLEAGGPGEIAALDRFKAFLQGIGDAKYVRENTLKVYAADAYLDDTLAVHRGAAEIENYFVKTSETMTDYQVSIDDIARSGNDYYVRWTMVFAAPALSGGKPVHSIGISQIRLNREGQVEFHQDFWDSGKNFFAHLPIVGGAVGFVRKRLEAD
jgi:hypothetical protein